MKNGKYDIPEGYTLFRNDLNAIITANSIDWTLFNKKKLLITGGSGFFGKWLVESLLWASESLKLKINLIIITRSKDVFYSKVPLVKNPIFFNCVELIEAELSELNINDYKDISHIFHFASDASPKKGVDWAFDHYISAIIGVKNILEIAKNNQGCSVLITSSGAVYSQLDNFFKDGSIESYDSSSSYLSEKNIYQLSKRNIETISAYYSEKYKIKVLICRCFAFAGAYLPLDSNYAFGNFIGDALNSRDIVISGDGKSIRSYMYMSDLVIWLLSILQNGKSSKPYNVGSPISISIGELALRIKNLCNNKLKIITKQNKSLSNAYYPSVQRVAEELNLSISVPLDEAILSTYYWYRNFRKIR